MEPREILSQKLEDWQHLVMHHSMHALFHYSRRCGLSLPQLMTLFKIHRSHHCGVARVGEELGVTSAAASQQLDKLVQLGYVERREDPEDRRGKLISLAPEGERILRESVEAQGGWIRELALGFPPEEASAAALLLDALIQEATRLDELRHGRPSPSTREDS